MALATTFLDGLTTRAALTMASKLVRQGVAAGVAATRLRAWLALAEPQRLALGLVAVAVAHLVARQATAGRADRAASS